MARIIDTANPNEITTLDPIEDDAGVLVGTRLETIIMRGETRERLTHQLQCAFCPLWFENFSTLFAHVREEHPHGYGGADTAAHPTLPLTRGKRMLPKSSDHAEDESSVTDFNPFLKPKDIGRVGAKTKVKLTGKMHIATGGEYGDQAMVEVIHKGKKYDLAVKLGKPSHRNLEKAVGNNEKKWKGKTITLEVRHYMKNDFISVN